MKMIQSLYVSAVVALITGCGGGSGDTAIVSQTLPDTTQTLPDTTQILSGKVVSIADGDTITVLDKDNNEHKIRLSCIDAPEKGQDFGTRSKDELASIIAGAEVSVEYTERDQYGRILGYVNNGSTLSNLEQVKRGMAWVYREYCDKCEYYDAEVFARNNFLGIWSQPNPIPPWEWRRDENGSQTKDWTYLYSDTCSISTPKIGNNTPDSGDGYSCGSKRFCTEMGSCDEAMYYFQDCDLNTLDGDNDGVPCESLCG